MGYSLGIDVGTAFTAAAIVRDGRAETVALGNHAATIPSVVFLREDATLLIGDAAERRGLQEPARMALEFKRRFGDAVPILLDRTPFSADRLTTAILRTVLDDVVRRQGSPPDAVAVAHPANWGGFKVDLLRQAVLNAGIEDATFVTEPVAAAVQYASTERVDVGDTFVVYDLGGGTFDAAVLRKTADGFETLGRPQGIERLGGIDFDEAVVAHVRRVVGGAIDQLDSADPTVRPVLARLREECIAAKESLSSDSDATVAVLLPNLQTQVRITRVEFEDMIRPMLRETIDATKRAIAGAHVETASLKAVLLAGGSSRIPLIGEMLRTEFERPVVTDSHPKHTVALGAGRLAAAAPARTVVLPPPPVPPVAAAPAVPNPDIAPLPVGMPTPTAPLAPAPLAPSPPPVPAGPTAEELAEQRAREQAEAAARAEQAAREQAEAAARAEQAAREKAEQKAREKAEAAARAEEKAREKEQAKAEAKARAEQAAREKAEAKAAAAAASAGEPVVTAGRGRSNTPIIVGLGVVIVAAVVVAAVTLLGGGSSSTATTEAPTTVTAVSLPEPTTTVVTEGPAALPPVPAAVQIDGNGSPQVLAEPLPSGLAYAEVETSFQQAQQYVDALAMGDWNVARMINPELSGLSDDQFATTYAEFGRGSLMLVDAREITLDDLPVHELLVVSVANTTDGARTDLFCFEWWVHITTGAVSELATSKGLLTQWPQPISPEGVRHNPELMDVVNSCAWST